MIEDQKRLAIKSHTDGQFVVVLPVDPVGRFIPRGTLLGYVLKPGEYHVTILP